MYALDRTELARQLDNALSRLYDHPYLESHPLASLLANAKGLRSVGQALSRRLIEAIETCKPDEHLPLCSAPWRNFRYLQLRYIQLKTAKEVARELGVSERQSRRIHCEAIDYLTSALWAAIASTDGTVTPQQGATAEGDKKTTFGVEDDEISFLTSVSRQQSVSLIETIGGVLTTMTKMAAAGRVGIGVDLPTDLPLVAVERTVLRQGLLSLLVAGLRSGARRISITAGIRTSSVELRLLLSPAYGPGRRGAKQEAAARAPVDPGRDRSLEVGSHLLATQGGHVRVEPGRGGVATIALELPFVEPTTVLVVDDNPDTVRLFRRYLCEGAYRVVEASSGEQAIQLARQLHPAAITLDIMMPGQDGWETLQTLCNQPETADIPIIVCSVIDQRDLALSIGAAESLAKPVTQEALLKALEHCLATSTTR